MTLRTYNYIRALVKRSNAANAVVYMKRNAEAAAAFEQKHAAELEEGWKIVEDAANRGCIRLFTRDHPVFQKSEIQCHFASKGFSFTDNSMEWWHEPKEKELR
jgi:hypothetical protein